MSGLADVAGAGRPNQKRRTRKELLQAAARLTKEGRTPTLDEVAAVAKLVPNSFCRHFKSRTGKTYTQFLTELRIGHACKLLLDNRISIKQLCYESGFNNFTCFHKNFKTITGKTPQLYQREHGIS